jgi:hypothetical protein
MRRGLGKEDQLHKQFAALIKKYEKMGKLNCSFWSYDASGENRTLQTGALLKAKGLRPGKSDYEFKIVKSGIAYHIYIEFKTETGKQSPNQKLFEESCRAVNESYHIARSVQDGLKILEEEGIIT